MPEACARCLKPFDFHLFFQPLKGCAPVCHCQPSFLGPWHVLDALTCAVMGLLCAGEGCGVPQRLPLAQG